MQDNIAKNVTRRVTNLLTILGGLGYRRQADNGLAMYNF